MTTATTTVRTQAEIEREYNKHLVELHARTRAAEAALEEINTVLFNSFFIQGAPFGHEQGRRIAEIVSAWCDSEDIWEARAKDYAKFNPLGGPAVIFEAMAARVRAGEDFFTVLDDCGFSQKGDSDGQAAIQELRAACELANLWLDLAPSKAEYYKIVRTRLREVLAKYPPTGQAE